ncbi:MAG: sigma-70 family RNA polymerase sigma factor [Cryomorphaceae bacterium]|nr:MAG: sigma-70 family RNA polymerase sigma factor [Cryomorphaceae bacterium]
MFCNASNEYFWWQPNQPYPVLSVQNVENISENTLREIVNGCVRNDRQCQERLYRMFYGKMMGVCMRYANDSNQAKDILQDGFIKVFNNLERYSFDGSFEGWVRRIMVNTAIDYFRKKRSSNVLLTQGEDGMEGFEEEVEEDQTNFDSPQETEFTMQDVIDAMQQLTPAYRAVFNLYVMENKTHQEIADELEISIGTSKSNFAKAKLRIRKILLNTK